MGDIMNEAVPLLWDIAEDSFRNNNITGGVQCLESIVQSKIRVLPHVEGQTRIRIAEVLMEHTYNIEEAKEHLEKSIGLLGNAPHLIDCLLKAHAHLASIHEQSHNAPLAKAVMKLGLDAAHSAPDWMYYFLMRLADAHIQEGNFEVAKNFLNMGVTHSKSRQEGIYEILFHLSLFQVSLLLWDLPNAFAIKQFLDDAIRITNSSPDFMNSKMARYYYLLLSTLHNIRTGDMKALPTSLGELKNSHLEYHAKHLPNITPNNQYGITTNDPNTPHNFNAANANPNAVNGSSNSNFNIPSNHPSYQPNYNGSNTVFTPNSPNHNPNSNPNTNLNTQNSSTSNMYLELHTNGNTITFNNNTIHNTFTSKVSAPFSYLDNEEIMGVLLNLLFAISSRPNNPQQSISLIDAGLRQADVLLQSGKLTIRQFCSVLRLKFHLFENVFYIKLTQCDLDAALLNIKLCHEIYLHHQQPGGDLIGGVGGFSSTLHVMCCLLAHACGMFDVAIKHATLALQKTKNESMQSICMLYLLLLYLQTGAVDAVERMVAQYCHRLQTHPQRTLKVLSTFVEGIVLRMRESNEEAKKKLSESLSLGQEINNSQATAQILNEISKIFLNQAQNRINHISTAPLLGTMDPQYINPAIVMNNNQYISEANELLKRSKDTSHSALMLAHHMGDIGTQLVSLQALRTLYQMTNDQSAQANQHLAYLQNIETHHAKRVRSVQHNVDFVLLHHLL